MFAAQTRVVFRPDLRCFYDTLQRRRLVGLASLLKRTYWPDYVFRRAYPPAVSTLLQVPAAASPSPRVSARAGRARGSLVDAQVAAACAAGGVASRRAHPLTLNALAALRGSGLTPCGSQVVVYDGRLATAVDVLARRDADGSLACVELKCSSNWRYDWSCGRMRGPLVARDDSLAQQHAVQADATRMLFERTYGQRARAYVLRVTEGGATLTRVERGDDVQQAVLNVLV
jgi:hypothetical protein